LDAVVREGPLARVGPSEVHAAGRSVPRTLRDLLSAETDQARTRAWERFVARHSRLLLKVAYENGRAYDGAMDRYAFTLERLRVDDFSRLRRYQPDGRTRFTTWLVVVARRLCLDHHRRFYGRLRRTDDRAVEEQGIRRNLVDFVMEEIDPETVVSANGDGTDTRIRQEELRGALEASLETLGQEDRLILRLRFEDGTAVADIARVLGVPTVFHVYRRLKKVLSRLRVDLEARGVDGPKP
jgi:RNA polymerase sigma factor (sigma-70 family)